jgi:hypothetical protein
MDMMLVVTVVNFDQVTWFLGSKLLMEREQCNSERNFLLDRDIECMFHSDQSGLTHTRYMFEGHEISNLAEKHWGDEKFSLSR